MDRIDLPPMDGLSARNTALALHEAGFWAVAIWPGSKRPMGSSWGSSRWEADRIVSAFNTMSGVGVGICLGPNHAPHGAWLADLEGDGDGAEDSLSTLFDGEVVETAGWTSARGEHRLILITDEWLESAITRFGGSEKTAGSGVYHFESLPGLELRVGGTKPDGTAKQVQSVCPPTRGTDGSPRAWNGVRSIAMAPAILVPEEASVGHASHACSNGNSNGNGDGWTMNGTASRGFPYAEAAFRDELERLRHAAEPGRNNQLNRSAFALGQLVGAGVLERETVEKALESVAMSIGLLPKEVSATIRSGLESGIAEPRDLSRINPPRNGVKSSISLFRGQTPCGEDPDDESVEIDVTPWPSMPSGNVYGGLVGEIVDELSPHTESDPFALLVQLLLMFGGVIGRGPYVEVEATRHYTNEFAILVGKTAGGRKGTSSNRIRTIYREVDPEWERTRILKGMSSGEGLISAVRDEVYQKVPVKEKGRIISYQDEMVDGGVNDKRLFLLESEFTGVLRVLEREGNKLCAIICDAWDGSDLMTLTKSPLKATKPHVSIVGHITFERLNEQLKAINIADGFANRFLFFAVKRSKLLPFGGGEVDLTRQIVTLQERASLAREMGRIPLDHQARDLWKDRYPTLTSANFGVMGDVLSRGAPHVRRLAMLYALCDGKPYVTEGHLGAALELWDYSSRCARFIFHEGRSLVDGNAERILTAIRQAGPSGMTRTEISVNVFNRNLVSSKIKAALACLLKSELIREEKDKSTGGAPCCRYFSTGGLPTKQRN